MSERSNHSLEKLILLSIVHGKITVQDIREHIAETTEKLHMSSNIHTTAKRLRDKGEVTISNQTPVRIEITSLGVTNLREFFKVFDNIRGSWK